MFKDFFISKSRKMMSRDIYLITGFAYLRIDREINSIYRRIASPDETDIDCEAISLEKMHDRGVPGTCYFICYVNRTGTTFLSECLSRTDLLGFPQEYLNTEEGAAVEIFSKRFGANSFNDYLSQLTRKMQSGTGVFGTKIGYLQLAYLTKHYDINSIFPNAKFIFVTRQNVALQAISWYVAVKTASWASFDKARNHVDYDRDEIIRFVNLIINQNARFENYFALNGINPLRIYYEEINSDVRAVVHRVKDYLGVDGEINLQLDETSCKVQRTSKNEDWASRLIEEVKHLYD
jgi:LPS sulfotransferase NodH